MAFDWYPFFPRAFKGKTLDLTLAQDGAYRRLIDEYMLSEAPLPDSDTALARIIGVSVDEWRAVAPIVRQYFEPSNGKLINNRCEEELYAQRMLAAERSVKATHAANTRWEKHRELNGVVRRAYAEHAPRMLKHATLQDTTLNLSSTASAVTPKAAVKKPSEVGRAELAEMFSRKPKAVSG